MATTVDTLAVRIDAEVSGLTAGVRQAETALKGLETQSAAVTRAGATQAAAQARATASLTALAKSTTTSTAGLNAVRGAMTSVAGAALQTAPGVAPLVSIIGSLALGSGVMVGVMAGMAALALAWDKITASARAAKEEQEKALQRALALGPTAAEQAAQRFAETTTLIAQQQQVAADLVRARSVLAIAEKGGTGDDPMAAAAALKMAQGEVARLSTKFNELETGITRNSRAIQAFQNGLQATTPAVRAVAAAVVEQVAAIRRFDLDADIVQPALAASSAFLDLDVRIAGVVARLREANRARIAWFEGMGGSLAPLTGRLPVHRDTEEPPPSRASQALDMLGQAATGLVAQFTPLGMLSTLLSSAFAAMQPAIEVLLMPVRALGQLLGGVVNRALSYFAEGIGYLIKGIGWVVDKINIFGGDGGIGKFGQEMIDGARAARKGLDSVGTAAERVSASISNMPEIFDLALRRRQAMLGEGSRAAIPGGGGGGGGTHYHFHNPPAAFDAERAVRDIERAMALRRRRGGVSELDLALGAA